MRVRELSCSCDSCRTSTGDCLLKEYIGEFQEKILVPNESFTAEVVGTQIQNASRHVPNITKEGQAVQDGSPGGSVNQPQGCGSPDITIDAGNSQSEQHGYSDLTVTDHEPFDTEVVGSQKQNVPRQDEIWRCQRSQAVLDRNPDGIVVSVKGRGSPAITIDAGNSQPERHGYPDVIIIDDEPFDAEVVGSQNQNAPRQERNINVPEITEENQAVQESRRKYYEHLQKTLLRMNFDELTEFTTKEVSKYQLPTKQAKTFHRPVDCQALDLYPTDAPTDMVPIEVGKDGNCLPRCGSLYLFGHERNHTEIRVRTILELAAHESYYSQYIAEYIMFSEKFTSMDKAKETYRWAK